MSRDRATFIGAVTLLLWAGLAVLTLHTAPVPPFLLTATSFAIGGSVGLAWAVWTGGVRHLRQVPVAAYVFTTLGLFSNHAFFFAALRWGPAAEVTLVNYTWPLLIVLLSAALPNERLRLRHLLGAGIAFAGLLVLHGFRPLSAHGGVGVLLALGSAVTWAVYSVGSRQLKAVPTEAVAVACLSTALFALGAHLSLEETVWPTTRSGWAALVLIGLGPAGVAFLTWDIGMKHGHIQLLGVAAYAAPLMSALLLVLEGAVPATPAFGLAALLITTGSLVASGIGLEAAFGRRRAGVETSTDG
jgi:drug/metabolite transporter (DMT)-like permease